MCGGEDFLGDIVGQRPDQRHALRGGERQIETVHTLLGEFPTACAVRGSALIEPLAGNVGVGVPTLQGRLVEAGRLRDRFCVSDDKPAGDAGFVFRVVLGQTAACRSLISAGVSGGVVVVLDAAMTQTGNRQHDRSLQRQFTCCQTLSVGSTPNKHCTPVPMCPCCFWVGGY